MKQSTLVILIASMLCRSGFGYTVDAGHKTVYADGTPTDCINGTAFALSQAVDGWLVNWGTNGQIYNWSNPIATISIVASNSIEISGTSPTTNFASLNCPFLSCWVGTGFPVALVQNTPGKTIKFHNLGFPEWNNTSTLGLISCQGTGANQFDISACYFQHGSSAGNVMWVSDLNSRSGDGPYGVFHSNVVITASGGSPYGVFIRENSSPSSSAWVRDGMNFGSISNFFVEWNVFSAPTLVNGSPAVDGDNGAKIVFQYNSCTNCVVGNHGADETSTLTNSCLVIAVVHNTFRLTPGNAADTIVRNRGGFSIVKDNTIIANNANPDVNSIEQLNYYRSSTGIIPSGIIDRHYSCACATNGVSDYLGTQQPGMGVVLGAASQDPIFTTLPWVSVPCYMTNNTLINVSFAAGFGNVLLSDSLFMQNNKDYFTNALPAAWVDYPFPYNSGGSGGGSGIARVTNLRVGITKVGP